MWLLHNIDLLSCGADRVIKAASIMIDQLHGAQRVLKLVMKKYAAGNTAKLFREKKKLPFDTIFSLKTLRAGQSGLSVVSSLTRSHPSTSCNVLHSNVDFKA